MNLGDHKNSGNSMHLSQLLAHSYKIIISVIIDKSIKHNLQQIFLELLENEPELHLVRTPGWEENAIILYIRIHYNYLLK